MKLIAPIEKAEDIVNKQYVDNKVSTKVENTEAGISAALDKISNNTSNATDKDVYITKVNDDDAVYDSIVEGDDKYLMQFPKSEEYDIGIFDATNKTITYYTKNTDNTFTAIE